MDGYTNAAEYVLQRIAARGDKTAQVDSVTGQKITFSDVCKMTANVAHKLLSAGVVPGSVVAICAENCLEYAGVVLGVLRLGAIAALYSPAKRARELQHSVSITKPTILYAPKLNPEQQDIIVAHTEITVLKWSLEELMEGNYETTSPPSHNTNESQPAFLLSSSGSTGLPKAVAISHSNIIWSLEEISGLMMEEEEPALGLMPFFHAYGLGLLLMALCEGTPFIVMSKFTPERFSSVIVSYKIKLLHIVSPFLIKMINGTINPESLKSIRAVYTGAGAVVPRIQASVLDILEPGARLYHSYGMTETTHVVCFGEVRSDKPGSPGPVLSCMKAKVLGHDGETLPAGEKGELCLSGPLIMSGYYGNPTATKDSFIENGWLKTGDLAWIDDNGYVYLVDRIKDIIKFQGYQISVTEIEQLISEQTGVSEVAVVGIPHDTYGEVPRAFIVPGEKEKPTEDQIEEAVKRELSHYKWLRGGVRFVESLPKTHTMKIFRKHLRGLP